jgi:hypothetical protein
MALSNAKRQALAAVLEGDMLRLHGAVFIGGRDLRLALRYKTDIAFRVAISRRKVGVPLFKIPGRKGHWALIKNISLWLAAVSEESDMYCPDGEHRANQQKKEGKPKPPGSK